MPTTFNVISLGSAGDIDTLEGNSISENASALVGLTFGSAGDPLHDNVAVMSEGDNGLAPGVSVGVYDQSGLVSANFSIDGGADQQMDGIAAYAMTVTYADGTTAPATATLFQDTEGNCYLAPPVVEGPLSLTLTAKAIASISIDGLVDANVGLLAALRLDLGFKKICFTPGTPILTPGGPRAVETLRRGDLVLTADDGPCPVVWAGGSKHARQGRARPVRIRAGALGGGLPERDLVVSRQHRLVLRGPVVGRVYGAPEVLLPAKDLVGMPGIAVDRAGGEVAYVHLLLERHAILFAAGAPAESLLTGPVALKALGERVERELRAGVPGVIEASSVPAREVAAGPRSRGLLARIARNRKPLVEPEPPVRLAA